MKHHVALVLAILFAPLSTEARAEPAKKPSLGQRIAGLKTRLSDRVERFQVKRIANRALCHKTGTVASKSMIAVVHQTGGPSITQTSTSVVVTTMNNGRPQRQYTVDWPWMWNNRLVVSAPRQLTPR